MSRLEKIFECILCQQRFSVGDIKAQLYYVSTGVCSSCYDKGLEAKNQIWCFGDFDARRYNECRAICPDRKICREYTLRQD